MTDSTCATCDGLGELIMEPLGHSYVDSCPDCNGTGRSPSGRTPTEQIMGIDDAPYNLSPKQPTQSAVRSYYREPWFHSMLTSGDGELMEVVDADRYDALLAERDALKRELREVRQQLDAYTKKHNDMDRW